MKFKYILLAVFCISLCITPLTAFAQGTYTATQCTLDHYECIEATQNTDGTWTCQKHGWTGAQQLHYYCLWDSLSGDTVLHEDRELAQDTPIHYYDRTSGYRGNTDTFTTYDYNIISHLEDSQKILVTFGVPTQAYSRSQAKLLTGIYFNQNIRIEQLSGEINGTLRLLFPDIGNKRINVRRTYSTGSTKVMDCSVYNSSAYNNYSQATYTPGSNVTSIDVEVFYRQQVKLEPEINITYNNSTINLGATVTDEFV